jgi:hypothetical protein
MAGVANPAENVGLTTWTQKSREQSGHKKNSGYFSSSETKITRNGA